MSAKEYLSSKNTASYTVTLWTLAALLFIASIAFLKEPFDGYRFIRGLVSWAFLGAVFFFKRKDTSLQIAIFFLLYGASSFLTIWYENSWLATAALCLNFVAFVILISALWPRVSFKDLGYGLTAIFVLFVCVNAYLLYEFIDMLKNFAQGNFHYATMLLGAMGMAATGFLALVFNHSRSSKASLYFTLAVFLIIFAEIFRAIAYYEFGYGDLSVYIARILLILGSVSMATYAIMEKPKNDELGKPLL
mgnify:CR=1 FL=1